ncbi:MAG: preprotein translocase subunit SecE [Candidatus Borkfalkiaceae bacterium]|nr:preprotein translocase subunit SecE [Christensenellaceae bacterium]
MSEETKNVQPAAADNSKAAANNAKKQANKNKKPNAFVRFFRWIGRKGKEIFSELKKVTWPTFPKVVKQTGVVLGVILVFLIFVTAVDLGLQELLKLVTNS